MNDNDMAPNDIDPQRRRRRDEYDDEGPPRPQGNGMATASLVLGVLSLCGGIASIPGLICGIVGLSRANQRGGSGSGMAIAGMVLSGIGLLTAFPLLIALLLPAVQKVREAAARKTSSNNLKQLSLAQMNYESANGQYSTAFHYQGQAGGEPSKPTDRLSWRVAMLPFIEQQNVYNRFRLDEPWNSPNNQPLSTYSIKTFIHPADAPPEPTTRYRVFYGGGAGYDLQRRGTSQAIPDGASNTIAIVEGGDRVTWSQFNEYPFSKAGPLPALGLPNSDVFQAAMFDGSIRTFRKSIDPNLLKSAIHAADGVGAPLGE